MKQRVLSGLVGLVLLAVVLYVFNTPVFNAVMALLGIMALYELYGAMGCRKNRAVCALGYVMAVLLPFVRYHLLRPWMPQIMFVVVLGFFVVALRQHERASLEKLSTAFGASILVPLFLSCAVYLREDLGPARGGFCLVVALGAAWLCDTAAYFVGTFLGRHKLAPRVSPKKTVEGSVGGVVVATLIIPLVALGYKALVGAFGAGVEIYHTQLMLIFPLLAVAGMLGDLSASVIKRQYGVKDFGNIMPGHGGVLDRFDSVLFTLPAMYVISQKVSVIGLV